MKQKNTFNLSLVILLFVLIVFSKNVYSQCNIPNEYQGNTGLNMICLISTSFIDDLTFQSDNPYLVVLNSSGFVVGSTSVLDDNLINGQTSLAVWGNDTFTNEIDGALEGEGLILKFVDGYNVYNLTPIIALDITGNGFVFTVNGLLNLSLFII